MDNIEYNLGYEPKQIINPCDINALDIEEIRKITFDLNDDNTESDEVWDRLITYFEERGF